MPDEAPANDAPGAAGESRYLLLVGGLLLIISMSLGWLWLTERSRRIRAERSAVQMRRDLDQARDQLKVLKSLPLNLPLPRASRPSTTAPAGRG